MQYPATEGILPNMESLLSSFLSPKHPSLKVCGITQSEDAQRLVAEQVPALGVNFWPSSKRYCNPQQAEQFLLKVASQIVRVGVFVNNAPQIAPSLLERNLIDIVQLHGDESERELLDFLAKGVPVIRSLSLPADANLKALAKHYLTIQEQAHEGQVALLLDAHAPGVYGGTGQTIDWEQAAEFIAQVSPIPVLLAGGLTPENAAEATRVTQPAGLDVASGAEISPGIKDFTKVSQLLASC